ncbi:hypothetical protein [Kordia sp.]|uniref:hypothetical protein n=1 Tax=Kordia sp. TaxID=1965332 RepID=UPI0025C11DE0|nr:hypothetical protein [Kordia sp.]MCH2193918.1 hypothetical protein [Kordia sp.]
MSHVLSYDHQKASASSSKSGIGLSETLAKSFFGTYKAPNTGMVTIYSKENILRIKAGKMDAKLFAEPETILFIKEAPLRFDFEKDSKGKVVKFIVFENAKAVEEAL